MRPFEKFYHLTRDAAPPELLVRAVTFLPERRGDALDLGAGAGRSVRFLLAQGFHVTAADVSELAVTYMQEIGDPSLQVIQASFEDFFAMPEQKAYDLVNASFSLPFNPKKTFEDVFAKVKQAVRPGGIFTGQLFGVNDTWNTPDSPMSFVTRAQAEQLLSDLRILEFTEEDKDGQTTEGIPKHWHIFHIIAQRPDE